MAELPGHELSVDEQAEMMARLLGKTVLGRDLDAEEFAAMGVIFKAAVEALKHGFITRLADHVQNERGTEEAEEFFGDNLRLD